MSQPLPQGSHAQRTQAPPCCISHSTSDPLLKYAAPCSSAAGLLATGSSSQAAGGEDSKEVFLHSAKLSQEVRTSWEYTQVIFIQLSKLNRFSCSRDKMFDKNDFENEDIGNILVDGGNSLKNSQNKNNHALSGYL